MHEWQTGAAADDSQFRLEPPRDGYAALVVAWVRGDRELYWLAPRTPGPLTESKVLEWRREGRNPLLMVDVESEAVIAYAELNLLDAATQEYWLGHIVMNPDRRGRGLGTVLTRMLIERAYERHGAKRVSLVVFPENVAAIRCYRAAGMQEVGYETHDFEACGAKERLIRFAVWR